MGGERLAAFEDVVVVAINYRFFNHVCPFSLRCLWFYQNSYFKRLKPFTRLGPLGFLCLDTEEAAGNQVGIRSIRLFMSPQESYFWQCWFWQLVLSLFWTWWLDWNGFKTIFPTLAAIPQGDAYHDHWNTWSGNIQRSLWHTILMYKFHIGQNIMKTIRVTIFGDSAGAASAGHLMLSQEATGLFHQVSLILSIGMINYLLLVWLSLTLSFANIILFLSVDYFLHPARQSERLDLPSHHGPGTHRWETFSNIERLRIADWSV